MSKHWKFPLKSHFLEQKRNEDDLFLKYMRYILVACAYH